MSINSSIAAVGEAMYNGMVPEVVAKLAEPWDDVFSSRALHALQNYEVRTLEDIQRLRDDPDPSALLLGWQNVGVRAVTFISERLDIPITLRRPGDPLPAREPVVGRTRRAFRAIHTAAEGNITAAEVASRLGVSTAHVYQIAKLDGLPLLRAAKRVRTFAAEKAAAKDAAWMEGYEAGLRDGLKHPR